MGFGSLIGSGSNVCGLYNVKKSILATVIHNRLIKILFELVKQLTKVTRNLETIAIK